MTYTKADLLAKVTELMRDDHLRLSWEDANKLGKPVNLKPARFSMADDISAAEFIDQLCFHLGIEYAGKFGRLSQLRKELSDE
jgi:hypothetical protein